MTKLSKQETEELLARMAHEIMAAVVNNQGGGAAGIDPGLSLDALSLVAAGLIEANPNFATNQARREEADQVGALVRRYVRAMRERYERTGQHGAETFGAILTDSRTVN